MSALFILKKEPPEKTQIFHFLEGRYFAMSHSVDMSITVFWETDVVFLKSVALQLFLKYSQSYSNFNVRSGPKLNIP